LNSWSAPPGAALHAELMPGSARRPTTNSQRLGQRLMTPRYWVVPQWKAVIAG
jgi:hypothetical protein